MLIYEYEDNYFELFTNCKLTNEEEVYFAYIPKKFANAGKYIFINDKKYFVSEVYKTKYLGDIEEFRTQKFRESGYSSSNLDMRRY